MSVAIKNILLKELDKTKATAINNKLPLSLKNDISKMVVSHFNVSDMNQVRAKFEGIEYLRKVTYLVYAVKAVELYFKQNLVNWDKINVMPSILFKRGILHKINAEVVTFDHDSLPLLNNEYKSPVICVLIRDTTATIVGVVNEHEFKNENNYLSGDKLGYALSDKKALVNFACLTPMDIHFKHG